MRDILEHNVPQISAGIEVAGVLILVVGALIASVIFAMSLMRRRPFLEAYQTYREQLGRAILLGLEFLVIGDIINTVAVDPSWENIGILGAIVLIRTFLSFALQIEIEGKVPWRRSQ